MNNDRLSVIAEKAGLHKNWAIDNPEIEKFAELIVLECCTYLNVAAEVYDQKDQDTVDRAARHIRQYFNVSIGEGNVYD